MKKTRGENFVTLSLLRILRLNDVSLFLPLNTEPNSAPGGIKNPGSATQEKILDCMMNKYCKCVEQQFKNLKVE